MTTDFLISISIEDGIKEIARTVKQKDDLLNKRVLEKFEIERLYWSRREIDWGIVTDEEINKTLAENISFIQGYKSIKEIDGFTEMEPIEIQDLIYEFIKRIVDDKRSMRNICLQFDKDMSLNSGCGLSIFKYLVMNKIIEIDILNKIDVSKNIQIVAVNSKEIKKVRAI